MMSDGKLSSRPPQIGDADAMESWLELWDGEPGRSNVLPGYGWVFPLGNGVANVGLGMLSTSDAFGTTDYKDLMRRWLAATPPEWGLSDEHRIGEIRGAALPMCLSRTPLYARGLLLVGDAGGMVLVAAKEAPAELCAKYGYELMTVRPDPLGVRVV